MNIALIAFMIIINLASAFVIFKVLSNIELKNKIILIAIGEIVMYVILFVVYGISSVGVNETIVNASRQIIIFTFLPINIICIELPIMLSFKKLQQGDIDNNKFKTRMAISIIIGIIILILEFNYIKDIQDGISNFIKNANDINNIIK